MEKANIEPIDYEKDFENWLENSPHVLLENDSSTIMWIGRQVSTTSYETVKFPDLMGIDSNGDVVIVELKKGKTPREVVAQILEYAAWASGLMYEDLNTLTMKYYDSDETYKDLELTEIHNLIFYPDDDIMRETKFNQKLRLYIVAEEITRTVKDVVKYLSNSGLTINCMKYEVYKASNGEFYISTGIDEADIVVAKPNGARTNLSGWNGDIPVKQIVKSAVAVVLKAKSDGIFTGKDIIKEIVNNYSNCNANTIRCQIYADCVNHTSRKHYKGGQLDLYFSIGNGRYRLYNLETDGKWNSDGERIGY